MRELPRGAMSRGEAILFIVVSAVVFVGAAYALGPVCFFLSPVALAIVFWYSLAKRYTTYTQLFLALAMAVAPIGGWLAAGGPARALGPWVLGAALGAGGGGGWPPYVWPGVRCCSPAGVPSPSPPAAPCPP